MTTVAVGRVVQTTVGHLWWKREVWTSFCGCFWVGHAWQMEANASTELRDHMTREHPSTGRIT